MSAIVGLDIDQFIPLMDHVYIMAGIILPMQTLTLIFWIIILIAIVKDRHYEEPNNLFIISFALADLVCVLTAIMIAFLGLWNHGYASGYIGT
jgi:hypothetical protein